MKKVLFLSDAFKLNSGAIDFAAYICNLRHSSLTGLFLGDSESNHRPEPVLRENIICSGIPYSDDRPLAEQKLECIQKNLARFEYACDTREIPQEHILIVDHPLERILLECRYADLLLIDPELAFSEKVSGISGQIVHHLLKDAECPVIVMPDHFEKLDEIVFAYDGSASSVFAIKQFTNTFPRLGDRKVSVITAHDDKLVPLVEKLKMKSWLEQHYSLITFHSFEGDSRSEIVKFVLGKKNIIVIMGAFGHHGWQDVFSTSHAEPLVRYISKALFLSHR